MLIRSRFLHLFVARFVRAYGSGRELVERFGLPDDAATARVLDVPVETMHELPEAVAERVGDPVLGISLAAEAPPGLTPIEYLGRSATTLREAIDQVVRFHALANESTELVTRESGTSLALVHCLPGQPGCLGRHMNELVLALLVRAARDVLSNPHWAPTRVALAHPSHEARERVRAFFGADVTFGARDNALWFSERDLGSPVASADRHVNRALATRARELLASGSDQDLLARLRQHIAARLRERPSLASVARAMAMSSRTLQRRLAEHDLAFTDVLDSVRRAIALELIDTPRAIADIAHDLGYADATTFSRAFHRWTGVGPAEHRRR